ncbi:MAG TPA: guanylate kinase [Gemmatimonadaceae bacterium]|nr:guanylate kinase [Gemmatimonadaceae bacterium]
MNPFPLILSSPSGGGKTTIARMLLQRREDVGYSISCTTRGPRNGEVHGRDYHFLTPDEFRDRRRRGEFAESAEVHGNFYGTLKSEIDRVFAGGRHVVMDIDIQGARQFVAAYPESVLVFLLPPSAEVLLGRLTGRNTESPEAVHRRLTGARDELAAVGSYQYVVVNDDLEQAYTQVASIVDAETVRHRRVPLLEDRVRQLMDGLDREITKYARAN